MTKSEALKKSIILKAYAEDKQIQCLNSISNEWIDSHNPTFCLDVNAYRIKPELKLVPFTIEDAKLFRDKWLKDKCTLEFYRITKYQSNGVNFINHSFTMPYKTLMDCYQFEDGSPCGKYIEE